MKHEIDLKNYQIRTDLAIEQVEGSENLEGIKQDSYVKNNIKVTNVVLDKNNKLGKSCGNYITIEFSDITDTTNRKNEEDI